MSDSGGPIIRSAVQVADVRRKGFCPEGKGGIAGALVMHKTYTSPV